MCLKIQQTRCSFGPRDLFEETAYGAGAVRKMNIKAACSEYMHLTERAQDKYQSPESLTRVLQQRKL